MRSKEDIIYINGRFLTQNLTGVQRYAIEIVKQLDKMNVGVKFILLMPKVESKINIKLDNIEIQKIGKYKVAFKFSCPLCNFCHWTDG